MDKCRLCLKNRKNLRSIFDVDENNTTFGVMVTSIANIKIQNNDGLPDKICTDCCKKLTEAYEFKICIERSNSLLHKTANLKRIHFDNIQDIKIKIEIDTECKTLCPPNELLSKNLFQNGEKISIYNNTSIKKIEGDYESCNTNDKALSVIDFLKTIRNDLDNDYDYDVEIDNGDSNSDSDYEPIMLKKKMKQRGSKFKKKLNSGKKYKKIKQVINANNRLNTPIKPVYMDDIKLVANKKKKLKSNKEKKKRRSEEKSVCPYCGFLTVAERMDKHILIHIGERKFQCNICSKGFFTQNSLNIHTKIHTDVKSFKCDQCIAVFISKHRLTNHMLTHADVKKYVCHVCSTAFKRVGALNRHQKLHDFAGKTVKCDLCDMKFYNKFGLNHHMRVHTRERPYNCEICSQPYSYKHDFNRHCLKKHGVFLKRRLVSVMNEEVLKQERALMRDLVLRAHGILKEGEPLNPFDGPQGAFFEGPQGALAFKQVIKAIQNKEIPIDYQI